MLEFIDGRAANAVQLTTSLRKHADYPRLAKLPHTQHICESDLLVDMARAVTAFEQTRGPEPWSPEQDPPLDWDAVCEAFAAAVIAAIVVTGNVPDLDATLRNVTA